MLKNSLHPDGTVVTHCWPNAGWMNAVNDEGTQRKWSCDDNIQVRLSPDSLLFEEGEIGGKKVLFVDDSGTDPKLLRRLVDEVGKRDIGFTGAHTLALTPEPPSIPEDTMAEPRRQRAVVRGGRSVGKSMTSMLGLAALAGFGTGGGWDLPFVSSAPPYQTKEPSPELDSIRKKMAAADAGILEKIMSKREAKEARRRVARGKAYKPCYPQTTIKPKIKLCKNSC